MGQRARSRHVGLVLGVLLSCACAGKRSEMPEPRYVESELPPWKPEESAPPTVDPFAVEGEWAGEAPPGVDESLPSDLDSENEAPPAQENPPRTPLPPTGASPQGEGASAPPLESSDSGSAPETDSREPGGASD